MEEVIRKRVSDFIARPTTRRPALKRILSSISKELPDTVVFGGMLREFALDRVRGFNSDIDLVSMATKNEIQRVAVQYEAIQNNFGGYRFVIDGQRFDIWSFPDTWAFRTGAVEGKKFEDLLHTSFFNLDAAFFHLVTHEVMCDENYEDWIDKKLLDINLLSNPHPEKMVSRTILLVLRHGVSLSRRLANYVGMHVQREKLAWSERVLLQEIDIYLEESEDAVFTFAPQVPFGLGS